MRPVAAPLVMRMHGYMRVWLLCGFIRTLQYMSHMRNMKTEIVPSGRSRGGAWRIRPPGGPNYFNFKQFWGNFGKIVCWCPSGQLAPHPLGNPGSATGTCLQIANNTKLTYLPATISLISNHIHQQNMIEETP